MQDWQKIGTASPNDTIFSGNLIILMFLDWQNIHYTDNILHIDIIRTGNTSKVFDMTE